MKEYVVYMLRCRDRTYYTGITSNLELRLLQHEEGKYRNCYTFKRRPVELIYAESFANVRDAIAAEKMMKGWSRKKKEALMEENWDRIQELSKRRMPFPRKTFKPTG